MSAGGGLYPSPPPQYSEKQQPEFGSMPPTANLDATAPATEPVPSPSQLAVVQTIAQPSYGPTSVRTTCPSCHASISTSVVNENTTKTHIIALILCALGCCLCFWIPYCVDSCKSANHYCPSCKAYLGQFKR